MRLLILFLFLFVSCSPSRILDRAKQRVYVNSSAFNEVGRKWAELNPIDTEMAKLIIISDTTNSVDTNTVIFNNYDTIVKCKTVYNTRFITKLRTIHDSVYFYIRDNRLLNTQKDSTNHYKESYFQSEIKSSELKNKLSKITAYLFALIILIVFAFVAEIYFKRKI